MNKFIYKGPDVNLGRFGSVKNNDILLLTEQEALMVERDEDKRFERVEETTKIPVAGTFIQIAPGMSKEQKESAEKHNKAEKERLEGLAKANDEDSVRTLELKGMKFEELVKEAERINEEAKAEVISFNPKKTSRAALLQMVLSAQRKGAVEEW